MLSFVLFIENSCLISFDSYDGIFCRKEVNELVVASLVGGLCYELPGL